MSVSRLCSGMWHLSLESPIINSTKATSKNNKTRKETTKKINTNYKTERQQFYACGFCIIYSNISWRNICNEEIEYGNII